MTASPAKYRVTPSSEDQAYRSNIHDAGVGGGELNSTSECTLHETQTKWTYFLLGCAILLPWTALVNSTSFFSSRLAGSPFYPTFTSYWSSVYTLTKLVFQFYSTFTSKQSSPFRRIFVSIIVTILLVTSLCLSTFVRCIPSTFFVFALFIAASMAVAASYLSTAVYAGAASLGASFLQLVFSGQAAIGAVYAGAASLGASFLQLVFSGQAAIGVIVSAVQVASSMVALWGLSPKSVSMEVTAGGRDGQAEEMAARIFLGVSAVFLCVPLIAYTWLTRQSASNSITGALDQHRRVRDTDELTHLLADDRRNPSTEPNSHVLQVLGMNLIFMFSISFVFSVTLAVSPAITARVQPVNPRIHPLLFTSVHFLVFHVGDFLGRHSCSFPCLLVWSGKKILAMSLLRALFIPLLLLCNVDRPIPVPPVIHSDILFMIIMLAMAYTNGYVATMSMLAVSSLEHNPRLKGRREDVDVAAMLGGSFLIVGLAIGALSSFGVQALI